MVVYTQFRFLSIQMFQLNDRDSVIALVFNGLQQNGKKNKLCNSQTIEMALSKQTDYCPIR